MEVYERFGLVWSVCRETDFYRCRRRRRHGPARPGTTIRYAKTWLISCTAVRSTPDRTSYSGYRPAQPIMSLNLIEMSDR